MEEIIEKIIRIEKEAQSIAKESEDRAKTIDESVKSEIETLKKSLSQRAEKKIETIKDFEASEAEKRIEEAKKRRDDACNRLNKIYAEKKDEWVGMIVDSVIGGK